MAMASECVWMVYFIGNEKILLLHLTSPKLIFTPFPPPLPPSALPLFPIAFSVISLNHYPRAVPTRKPLLSLVLEAPFISSDEFFHLRDKRKEILLCIRKNTVPLVWWYFTYGSPWTLESVRPPLPEFSSPSISNSFVNFKGKE